VGERKTKLIVIHGAGRDKGKTFVLTEMSAWDADIWATKALQGMARAKGLDIDPVVARMGWGAVAAMGIKAFFAIPYEDLEPLFRQLTDCVQYLVNPAKPGTKRAMIPQDIEEPLTLQQLRWEVFELHGGFFPFASQYLPRARLLWNRLMESSSNIQTSQETADASSPQA
jgi:hypothetical protein